MKYLLILILACVSTKTFSSDVLQTVKEDAISPYTTEALPIFEIGTGLTVLTYLLKHSSLQPDIADAQPLGKYSKIGYSLGQLLPNAAYAVFMGSDYLYSKDPKSRERMELMIKATIYADLNTEILKRSFNEKRPNGGKLSFPSGHTTCAFAFASIVTMEHSLPWAIAANSMAAFVGFSRMNDNAHYLHDVVAGATIGTMYGVGLYYANKKREEANLNKNAPTTSSTFVLLPLKDGLATSLLVNY